MCIPRNMHIVALCCARLASASLDGFGVLPSGLVMMIVCDTSGSVSCDSSAAAVPNKLLTPGMIVNSIPNGLN